MQSHETGNAKNVANLNQVIIICTTFGADYNPNNVAISLAMLTQLYNNAVSAIQAVQDKHVAYSDSVHNRQQVFHDLAKLSTRILAASKSSGLDEAKIEAIKSANRKIQGTRAINTKVNPDADKTKSVSHQSYDMLTDSFQALIAELQTAINYNPNSADLQISALTQKVADMKTATNQVISSYIELSKARISRNEYLYSSTNGIQTIANQVKSYIASLYGYNSPSHKLISHIHFTSK